MKNLSCFILCGGNSTRLKKKKINLDKPFIFYKDKTLIEHHLEKLCKLKIDNFFVNLNKSRKFYENILIKWQNKLDLNIFYEEKPKGTYNSIQSKKKYLKDNILIIYGDNYHDVNFNQMLDFFFNKKLNFLIGAYKKKDLSTSGRLIFSKNNILTKIEEKKKSNINITGYANSGIYILKKGLLKKLNNKKNDFAKNFIPYVLKKKKKIHIYKYINKCISFDTIGLLKKNKIVQG